MANLNPYKLEIVPGPVAVTFAEDFRVEIAFVDGRTNEVLVDCTGDNSVMVSDLLSSLPADVLAQLVYDLAPRMVAIAKGVDL